jgi:hypothetical protein
MAQATPSLMISGHREGAQQPAGRIAASLTIIVIIGIGNQGHSGPDAVIVSGLWLPPNIGNTAFMKGFGIAIRANRRQCYVVLPTCSRLRVLSNRRCS